MEITNKLSMVSTNGEYLIEYLGHKVKCEPSSAIFSQVQAVYILARNTPKDKRGGIDLAEFYALLDKRLAEVGIDVGTDESRMVATLKDLIKFFTEFSFEPNFRFVNSLSHALAKSKGDGMDYILHYFSLIDSPYKAEIKEKMNSHEFSSILDGLSTAETKSVVNSRFKVYYGSQGTGKTTLAMKETDGRCMVCNSSMLPSDLMEDFVFVDGKATFQPSALWRSMVEGTKIVLDEINLLPFDSLRFLQTILDGKKEFLYKGNRVEIADGFQIIGTMNLTVNGMTYGLPEPLIDRASEMRKFSLKAEDLLSALA